MTLLAPIFAGSVEDPETPLGLDSLDSLFAGQPTASGQRVTEEKSLGISTVWRAVNLIASSVASLPLHAYKSQEGARVKAGGRAAKLLADPHPDMTPFDLWEIVGAHLLLWGNAYLLLRGTPQDPIAEMWPIHPGRVKVGRLGGPTSMGKKIYVIDGSKVYTDDDILHIPGFGYDGICGVSPIRAARQGIGLALAAEEFGATLFGSNSLATGVLQTEQRLTPEQAQQLQARWTARRASLGPYDPIVLGGGLKFDQLSIPPADAQFLQSREFQVAEVARMFGIPPHMLMSTEKTTSWGSGIEQMSIGYVVYTLRFILTRIEQRLSRVLRPQAVYARFSVEGLLRGDSAQRSAFYRTMWELGALSTNEIRELEERPPVEGGDVRFRPLNFGELDAARGLRLMKECLVSDSRYRFHGLNQPARRSVLNMVEPAEVDEAGVVTFQLYDPIDSWGGEWGVSAKEFTAALSLLDESAVNEIRVHINSPGGEVFEAITIINALRRFDARVVAVVDGLAASAASVLAAAADELVMAPNSTLMIHDAWGVCVGPATDMRSMADLLDKLSDNIADVYAAKAGGSAADWRERMRAETWYTADEAVEAGLANSVEARGPVEPAASFDLSIYQPSPVTGQVAAFWDGASALAATRHRLNGEKVS